MKARVKPKAIKSCASVVPDLASGAEDAVRAMVEGALVADFDPDTYRSDRKGQSVKEITVVAPAGSDAGSGVGSDSGKLQNAMTQGRVIGESQNFTRELVNEPSVMSLHALNMKPKSGLMCGGGCTVRPYTLCGGGCFCNTSLGDGINTGVCAAI
jgi:leucyl aminopeptidase